MTSVFTRKALAAALLAATGMGAASVAQAQEEGKWMVRARAVYLDSANHGSTDLGAGYDQLNLRMDNRWVPELDISYFFTPNIAAELILTYPQKQHVHSDLGKVGTFKHLPPTLTLQYHFTGLPYGIKPYAGAGINYTRFSDEELGGLGEGARASIDSNSFGPALQLGVDVPITKNLYFNLDIKKVYIRTDVAVEGTKVGKFKADPILMGFGIGYRF